MQSNGAGKTFGDTYSPLGAKAPQVSWPSFLDPKMDMGEGPAPIIGSDIGNSVVNPKVYLIVHCSLSDKDIRMRKGEGGRRKRRKMGWNGGGEKKR